LIFTCPGSVFDAFPGGADRQTQANGQFSSWFQESPISSLVRIIMSYHRRLAALNAIGLREPHTRLLWPLNPQSPG
jgi:hypothetical protein